MNVCIIAICSGDCGNGVCDAPEYCVCDDGWEGDNCDDGKTTQCWPVIFGIAHSDSPEYCDGDDGWVGNDCNYCKITPQTVITHC